MLMIVLGGCRSLDEIASNERSTLASAVPVGSSFPSASPTLTNLGYKCELCTGRFATESGQVASAPTFLWCSKQRALNIACGAQIQVIVVPQATSVAQVHVSVHDVCL